MPTFLIFGTYAGIKKKILQHIDRRLMEAYSIVESETCQSCGIPTWHGRSTDNTIDFKVDKIDCWSCKTLEASELKKNAKKYETVYITPIPVEGFDELPTRADYLERLTNGG